ncbi:MAG: RsmD family RNA methyltransferase [Desulfovibrio sp.]|jgi:16S rRNA (guanine966-N2)-methyltransferase|nr:RsmD family RNA methyltransferase [Desulfovibrio sp.]
MRIISGTLRGRVLKTARGEGFRPAMGRTREALFSLLTARGIDWPRTRVLDLFAGSGSLAFEAVSRGAPEALVVEKAEEAVRCLRRNIADLCLEGKVSLVRDDALRFLRRTSVTGIGLVFLDPPYRENFIAPCLALLPPHLAADAFVTAEIEKEAELGATPDCLAPEAERLFGRTRVLVWRFRSGGDPQHSDPPASAALCMESRCVLEGNMTS